MTHSHSLQNQFLIATPQLNEGIFKASVTYICEHSEEGAMGVIVNRPSNIAAQQIFDELDFSADRAAQTAFASQLVMLGGPVDLQRGFVLHRRAPSEVQWSSSLPVSDEIALTGSRDILRALSAGRGPKDFLLLLGYAGWSAGQLEEELAGDGWLVSPATTEILFATPCDERAAAAAALLGIDLASLASHSGHA